MPLSILSKLLLVTAALVTLSTSAIAATVATSATAAPKPIAAASADLGSTVLYAVYTSIASPSGDLNGVTAQLPRLKTLGVNMVWLMPITPIGQPYNDHPAIGSPYCVHDYYAVNPAYGTAADLKHFIAAAHALHVRVILDEVLNHTAWDNALIVQHPEFYVHSDQNPTNPNSIVEAFNYADVAQLNYSNHALWSYMDTMLAYWVTQYHVDGFRFDCTDNPDGPNRMISAAFWLQCGQYLRHVKPNIVLLGECNTPDLALKPFAIDYGWQMYGALKDASNGGNAQSVVDTWKHQTDAFPAGMLHMSIQDDWDDTRDVNTFGGPDGALAAAAFNLTINGVPLIYNGMEIGNTAEAVNPHAAIQWANVNPKFVTFYHQMISLRDQNPALQQGTTTWLTNSTPSQVLTYTRSAGGTTFLVEINLSNTPAAGAIVGVNAKKWRTAVPSLSDPSANAKDVAAYSLTAKGFVIYEATAGDKTASAIGHLASREIYPQSTDNKEIEASNK